MDLRFDREIALKAALRLLNEVGIDKLTMRALGNAINVQAPSLYYYFPSKQALLDAMADAIVQPAMDVIAADSELNTVVLEVGRRFRNALLQYRDGAKVFAGSYAVTPGVLKLSDTLLAAFLKSGFDETAATHSTFNLLYYVLGFVLEEQAFAQRYGDAVSENSQMQVRREFRDLMAKGYPAIDRSLEAILNIDFDKRFDFGLATHLNGFKAMLNEV